MQTYIRTITWKFHDCSQNGGNAPSTARFLAGAYTRGNGRLRSIEQGEGDAHPRLYPAQSRVRWPDDRGAALDPAMGLGQGTLPR